jgi:hypothetical protein
MASVKDINSICIGDKYWCNKNPDTPCDSHSYSLLSENTICVSDGDDTIFKYNCIVCDKVCDTYTNISVLHSPRIKYIVKSDDKLCYTYVCVSTCKSDRCMSILDKVSNDCVCGRDKWDIYDEVLASISYINKEIN